MRTRNWWLLLFTAPAVLAALLLLTVSGCGDEGASMFADGGLGMDAMVETDAGPPPSDAGGADLLHAEPCLYAPDPNSGALEQTHKIVGGTGILPSGRAITPEGMLLRRIGLFPGNMVLTPDGKTLVITDNGWDVAGDSEWMGRNRIVLVDTATWTIRQTLRPPGDFLFYGLAVSPDGTRIYAAGGFSKRINVYCFGSHDLIALCKEITTKDYPAGLTVSRDGKTLYAAMHESWKTLLAGRVDQYDAQTGSFLNYSWNLGQFPLAMALSSDSSRLYVSLWGGLIEHGATPAVYVVNTKNMGRERSIQVGKNPEQILDDSAHGRLFVMNSDQDTVSVINLSTESVSATISLADNLPSGVSPLSAALSADGKTLYVAAAAKNSIEVVDVATMKVKGSIPTAWYPVSVLLSKDGKKLYVLNAKGEGSGDNKDIQVIQLKMDGVLQVVDIPDDPTLARLSQRVEANNQRPTRFFPAEQCQGKGFPIPWKIGDANSPIEHVIFVFKENRTFDQVFGDFEGAERDQSLLMFGENITPNHHKLAREFTLLDNFYTESEISSQGHLWATGMKVNDFSERTWIGSYRGADDVPPAFGVILPITSPLHPYIFEHLVNEKIDFIDYGEAVGMSGHIRPEVLAHWDLAYPGVTFYLGTKDIDRANYVIDRINKGTHPKFTFMILPRNHTYGTEAGKPSPESMVADNDEALGKLVESVSQHPTWKSTLIFVTEDDAQDGCDHVDAHRSYALVISPYARRGHISKVHHAFASFYATLERILNFKPLTPYDRDAAPLFDCFTSVPDFSPYFRVPRTVPEDEVNTPETPGAAESATLDFSQPDGAPELQRILWNYMQTKRAKQAKQPKQATVGPSKGGPSRVGLAEGARR